MMLLFYKTYANKCLQLVFDTCLNHLPARYAQVFMLREMIELSTEEICQKLELSLSNVNVLMYRSRTR